MKLVFFGISDIGVPILNALTQQHEVAAVVTSPDKATGRKQLLTPSPIASCAEGHGLQTFKPEKVKNNPEFLNTLQTLEADLFVVVSYGKILPLDLLDIPRLKTINVHFSLLPKYRGPAPVQFALLSGETTTGTTIFILDELVDHGPILASAELAIDPADTNPTLQNKLAQLSCTLLLETLPKYETGQLTAQKQNHDEATKTKIISKDDGRIDWQDSAEEIFNRFRAFQPWPGIYTQWQGKTLKILDCSPHAQPPNLPQGQAQNELIGCGQNTALELRIVQLEGKTPVAIKDFLNGYPEFANTQL
jgi:methionyl-tRNA formyltransferase